MFILNLICLFVVDFVRFFIFGSLEWYKGLEIENGRGKMEEGVGMRYINYICLYY